MNKVSQNIIIYYFYELNQLTFTKFIDEVFFGNNFETKNEKRLNYAEEIKQLLKEFKNFINNNDVDNSKNNIKELLTTNSLNSSISLNPNSSNKENGNNSDKKFNIKITKNKNLFSESFDSHNFIKLDSYEKIINERNHFEKISNFYKQKIDLLNKRILILETENLNNKRFEQKNRVSTYNSLEIPIPQYSQYLQKRESDRFYDSNTERVTHKPFFRLNFNFP